MINDAILYGDIVVEGFENLEILSLTVCQEMNEHATMSLRALVSCEDAQQYIDNLATVDVARLLKGGDVIFVALLKEKKVTKLDDVNYIALEGASLTYLMDIAPRSRSFQHTSMSYHDLIKTVVADYPKGGFLDMLSGGAAIGGPIIQYKETDWAFLKRLASHFNGNLAPSAIGEGPQFCFGNPPANQTAIEACDYSERRDYGRYKAVEAEIPAAREDHFVTYQIETCGIYDLGDMAVFNGDKVCISKTTYSYTNSVIRNICHLVPPEGLARLRAPNWNIAGSSIFGRVLATSRDNVRIHLEIDGKQDAGKAFWYPYASMYASEDETGWYCMPEIGDTVRLYHPDGDERRAMAINAVKPHDPTEDAERLDPRHRMADSDVKYLRTANGKEVKFRPDGIDIIAKDGTVFISLNDDGTMAMNSNDVISFTALNDIEIKAKNVNFEATEKISLKSKGSTIDLVEGIAVTGEEVKTNC